VSRSPSPYRGVVVERMRQPRDEGWPLRPVADLVNDKTPYRSCLGILYLVLDSGVPLRRSRAARWDIVAPTERHSGMFLAIPGEDPPDRFLAAEECDAILFGRRPAGSGRLHALIRRDLGRLEALSRGVR
jgi:hypothetical protein